MLLILDYLFDARQLLFDAFRRLGDPVRVVDHSRRKKMMSSVRDIVVF